MVSVGLNALVSPILGALSDRGGRRLPYLLFFTLLCIVPTLFIGWSPPVLGVVLFVIANFAYQAALIYYDSTLKSVARPATRGRLSGIGVAVGYAGTIFAGLFLSILDVARREPLLRGRARCSRVFAIPIFLFVRESGPIGRVSGGRRHRLARASSGRASRTPARCRACSASSSPGSSTPTR